jgi:hypothetical protein
MYQKNTVAAAPWPGPQNCAFAMPGSEIKGM